MNRYSIVRGRNQADDICYGIALQGSPEIMLRDLFRREEPADRLLRLLNNNDVSPVHFGDIVDDFLP